MSVTRLCRDGLLTSGALQFIPGLVEKIFRTLVSLGRITEFLNRSELDLSQWDTDDTFIAIEDATFSWPVADPEDADPKAFRLRDITVQLPQGKLTLVCGPLGSGKSLFVSDQLWS